MAKIDLSAYNTKSNRKKLTGAYSDKSPVKGILLLQQETQVALYSTEGRALIFSTAQLTPKTTRASQGVAVMSLKRKSVVRKAVLLQDTAIVNESRYRTRSLPAAGALLKDEDLEEKQISLDV